VIHGKGIYDTATSTTQSLQLQEKPTAPELLAYLENIEANNTETRWVHGGTNLADGLTKVANHPTLKELLESSSRALVQGPTGRSGKKRQALGLDKLSKTEPIAHFSNRENFRQPAWKKLKMVWPTFGCDSDSEDGH